MENPIIRENNFEETKKVQKEFYTKIGRVWSPTLGDHVAFNKFGFRHLIWKGAIQRPKSEQIRRLALLAEAKNMIEDPSANVIYRKEPSADFWAFTKDYDGKTITSVVRQIDDGGKHFFSAFEGKQKIAP